MKKIFFIIALLLPVLTFSQSLGIKSGIITYKPFHYNKYIVTPVNGIVFKYSGERFGFGIEPSIASKIIYSNGSLTDNSGNKLNLFIRSKSTSLEIPVYVFFKAIDSKFKLNIEGGFSFYGNTNSMLCGFYSGYKINNLNIGINYRINGTLGNQFTGAYQSAFISAVYNF